LDPIWKKIWSMKSISPRIIDFLWRCIVGASPTKSVLTKRLPSIDRSNMSNMREWGGNHRSSAIQMSTCARPPYNWSATTHTLNDWLRDWLNPHSPLQQKIMHHSPLEPQLCGGYGRIVAK
jgi:hypothetical protein